MVPHVLKRCEKSLTQRGCYMCICLILGHNGLVSVSHFSDTFTSVHDRLHILQEDYSS